ncbi:MAG: sulfotransferase [Flavobacteriales bacterium]|nr:sulfotransferase [Flavobacteriales bacterium]
MKKIELMIIGAQKAGTTSLKNYLGEHPQLLTHEQSEFGFFRDNDAYQKGYESAVSEYFPSSNSESILIAKNAGMYYEIESIIRLKKHNPNCKIVFLLREPVSRFISAYKMEKFNGWIKADIDDFIGVVDDQSHQLYRLFLKLGNYSAFLDEILEYFDRQNILLIDYVEFQKNTPEVCARIFNWLNVDSTFQPNLNKKHNQSKKAKSPLLTKLISRLRSPNNVLKKAVKIILPSQTFAKIGNQIIDLNKSKKTIEIELNSEQIKTLTEFYKPYNLALIEKYDFNCQSWLE